MRSTKVKVALWGFGAMGSGMAKMILKKQGFEIVGVCDRNPDFIGRTLEDVLQMKTNQPEVVIKANIEEVVDYESCDIVLLATDSFTDKAYEKIKYLLELKLNVISTAEEMAYPCAKNPQLSKRMDELAKKNGVTVLGTGVNPGMMMDLLVVFLTGICEDVESIQVSRVNSLSPFGKTVMEEQGVGLTQEEFEAQKAEHKIAGHVGFYESVKMINDALGLKVNRFEQQMEPIITQVDRKSAYGFAKKGDVCGVDMKAQAYENSSLVIEMHHPQQIEPQLGGVKTGDYITINGTPPVHMAINPEVDGGIGTIAICVNMIPHVINATPGLKTMLDLPVPRAIIGDVRAMINR